MRPSSRSTALLAEIAATLDVPVEHFTAPHREPSEAQRSPSLQVALLLLDPDGSRVATAFAALPRQMRLALANTAEALAGHAGPAAIAPTGEPR